MMHNVSVNVSTILHIPHIIILPSHILFKHINYPSFGLASRYVALVRPLAGGRKDAT
jgi:hypothetical protein